MSTGNTEGIQSIVNETIRFLTVRPEGDRWIGDAPAWFGDYLFAVWFHRPARDDAWHLYDVHSLVNAGGRGVLRGTMHDVDRHIMVSVAQEMLLRPFN